VTKRVTCSPIAREIVGRSPDHVRGNGREKRKVARTVDKVAWGYVFPSCWASPR